MHRGYPTARRSCAATWSSTTVLRGRQRTGGDGYRTSAEIHDETTRATDQTRSGRPPCREVEHGSNRHPDRRATAHVRCPGPARRATAVVVGPPAAGDGPYLLDRHHPPIRPPALPTGLGRVAGRRLLVQHQLAGPAQPGHQPA